MRRWGAITMALACAGALAAPARAAEIAVTTTADELAADGACSLREAVSAANADAATGGCAAGSGADRIVVPGGTYVLTRIGSEEDANATGDLDVTGQLTVSGPATISGDDLDRVLDARSPAGSLTVDGLTIRNGRAPGGGAGLPILGGPGQSGGAGAAGGGIRAAGSLTLRDCRVDDNRSGDGGRGGESRFFGSGDAIGGAGGAGGAGGGVAVSGPLLVERCTFIANSAGNGGAGGNAFGGPGGTGADGGFAQSGIGGDGGSGGALWTAGQVTVRDSRFLANASGAGGKGGDAIGGAGGNATGGLTGGTGGTGFGGFGGYGGDGGALFASATAPADLADVQRSAFVGNAAGPGGAGGTGRGGIGGTGGPSNGTGGAGGVSLGGWGRRATAGAFRTAGVALVQNVTFADNVAPAGAAGGASFGGIGGHGLGTGSGGAGGEARGSHGGDGGFGGALAGADLTVSLTTFAGSVAGAPGEPGQVLPGPGGAPGQTGGSTGPAGATVAGATGAPASGRHVRAEATVVLGASIFGAGAGAGCAGTGAGSDGGANVSAGDLSCPGVNADPRLRPPADNGGATPTMGLDPGSPARDRIPADDCPAVDQRGFARPAGTACDAGAYEATSPDAVTGPASATTARATTISGRVTANAPSAVAWVEYGLGPDYGAASPEVAVAGGRAPADVGVALTGLEPRATYHYRVVARNADGTTAGADATFTTPDRSRTEQPDTKRPRLRKVSLQGRRLRLTLSEPATVVVRAQRCRRRAGRRCTAWKVTATARFEAKAGRTSRKLPKRLVAGRGLRRLVVRATDEAGNRGRPRRLRLR